MRKNDDGDGDDDYKIVSFSTLLNLVGTMKRVMWFLKAFFSLFSSSRLLSILCVYIIKHKNTFYNNFLLF